MAIESKHARVMFAVNFSNKDHAEESFKKWLATPAIQAEIEALVPQASASKEDLVGFESFGTNADAVKTYLNTSVTKYVGRELVAAHIASIVLPNSKNVDEQTTMRKSMLEWVDANTDNDCYYSVFTSKKGKGGGIQLRAALSID